MGLPLGFIVNAIGSVLPVLKRKGVKAGAAVALSGVLAGQVGPEIATWASASNLVPVIEALSNLAIAVGGVVALLKGRKVSRRPRRAASKSTPVV